MRDQPVTGIADVMTRYEGTIGGEKELDAMVDPAHTRSVYY